RGVRASGPPFRRQTASAREIALALVRSAFSHEEFPVSRMNGLDRLFRVVQLQGTMRPRPRHAAAQPPSRLTVEKRVRDPQTQACRPACTITRGGRVLAGLLALQH